MKYQSLCPNPTQNEFVDDHQSHHLHDQRYTLSDSKHNLRNSSNGFRYLFLFCLLCQTPSRAADTITVSTAGLSAQSVAAPILPEGATANEGYLKQMLSKEKRPETRKDIISMLSRSATKDSLPLLMDTVGDASEAVEVREAAGHALAMVDIRVANAKGIPDQELHNSVVQKLIQVYESGDAPVKRKLITSLFILGERNRVIPVMKAMLKDGDLTPLRVIRYYRTNGNILITVPSGASMNEKEKLTEEGKSLLEDAVSSAYPDRTRVTAAQFLINLTLERQSLITPLAEVVNQGHNLDDRLGALGLLARIGGDQAKAVVIAAQNDPNPKLQSSARRLLMFYWNTAIPHK